MVNLYFHFAFHSFYMDYVGCKVSNIGIVMPLAAGFIWTMWDVKDEMLHFKGLTYDGFIWTMWDVKIISFAISGLSASVLYGLCGM